MEMSWDMHSYKHVLVKNILIIMTASLQFDILSSIKKPPDSQLLTQQPPKQNWLKYLYLVL